MTKSREEKLEQRKAKDHRYNEAHREQRREYDRERLATIRLRKKIDARRRGI